MTIAPAEDTPNPLDTQLALGGYILLLASVFFVGAPAFVAAVIAYVRRPGAPALAHSHYGFQLLIFWVGFALCLAAGVAGLAGVLTGLGEVVGLPPRLFDTDGELHIQLSTMAVDGKAAALLACSIVLLLAATLWLLIASVVGLIRLASGRAMRNSASA